MLSCCSCFTSDDQHDDYIPLPMSPTTAAANGGALPDQHELLLVSKQSGSPVNLLLLDEGLVVTRRKQNALGQVAASLSISKASSSSIKRFPYLQVLSARSTRNSPEATATRVSIAAIYSKGGTGPAKLFELEGEVHEVGHDREERERGSCRVEWWCEELMRRAYDGVKPNRRLRVLLNPIGGRGKAKQLWETEISPVLRAAACVVKVEHTGSSSSPSNATNLARTHDITAYDALVTVSGDGIVHEVLNGLASRPDALAALQSTPIVPIPAGSGNALQVNLEGPQRANDCVWAALAAIKGTPVALDLCSVTQKDKRYYSFLSQAFGLMADLDLGTEHLRWMGDTRFTVGYVQGALTRRTYPVELAVKIAPHGTDKAFLAKEYNDALTRPPPATSDDDADQSGGGMPELKFGTADEELPDEARGKVHEDLPERLEEGWHTLKTDVQFVYGGKLPFVAKDVKLFPPASGNDGLIDLAIVGPISRMDALSGMDGAATGQIFHNANTRYYRCSAYRLTPLGPKGYISIDGESVPHEPFEVEVHQGLARCLSLGGRFWGEEILVQ